MCTLIYETGISVVEENILAGLAGNLSWKQIMYNCHFYIQVILLSKFTQMFCFTKCYTNTRVIRRRKISQQVIMVHVP